MIDPKLNVEPQDRAATSAKPATKEEAARLQKVSSGLSVNNTIASNANLSVGGRGVDTSGVSAGSGAGAGMTRVDGGQGATTDILPGNRGSGTTPLGASDSQAIKANFPASGADELSEAEISEAAYSAWCDRGCPVGSPEVDWQTAIDRLRSNRSRAARA